MVSCCVYDKSKSMQHTHGLILYMLDYWADPVVHLLLLKSSMTKPYLRDGRAGNGLDRDVCGARLG